MLPAGTTRNSKSQYETSRPDSTSRINWLRTSPRMRPSFMVAQSTSKQAFCCATPSRNQCPSGPKDLSRSRGGIPGMTHNQPMERARDRALQAGRQISLRSCARLIECLLRNILYVQLRHAVLGRKEASQQHSASRTRLRRRRCNMEHIHDHARGRSQRLRRNALGHVRAAPRRGRGLGVCRA